MIDLDGKPYGVPVNFVWDGDDSIYIHCAPEGKKIDILECHDRVSFCVVGNVNLLPSQFTPTTRSASTPSNSSSRNSRPMTLKLA